MDEEIVVHILEDHFPRMRIKVLVLKSLVWIDHDNELRMHDLLRDMGREIVRKKSPNDLGKRCRLWSHEEAFHVLKKHKGTQNVEGLLLNLEILVDDCSLKVEAFKKMSGLRLLQIDYAYLEGDFDHFPGELKWLSWKGLRSECTISHQEKLSVLDLSEGWITDNWSGWQHIQLIKTLKVLDLRDCFNLTRTPNFSRLTSLKRLILDDCKRLVVCHESIGQLKNLDFLSLKNCVNLVELPDSICKLSSVKSLILEQCSNLERLPRALGSMISLTELDIGYTHIGELPDAIGSLEKLEKLSLYACKNLVKLPCSMGNLRLLHHFDMCMTGIVELPKDFARLSSLKFLDLSSNKLCSLPVSISCLSCLQELYLGSCGLVELPKDFGRLSSLKSLRLSRNKLRSLPASFSCLSGLQTLELGGCTKLQSIPELPSSLIKINANDCSSMERLPELSDLKFLQELDLSLCEKLSEIQGISGLPLLQTLNLSRCTTLQSLPELPSSLVTLDINLCISMETLPNPSNLKNLEYMCLSQLLEIQGMKGLVLLQKLCLVNCHTLQSLPELSLGNLRELLIWNCRNLSMIQGISCLPRLQILSLKNCKKLQSLPMLPSSLIRLKAYGCILLERLPDMSNLKNLEALDLRHCNNLAEIKGLEGLESLVELNILWCDTCINNFLKIVAQGSLPSASYYREWMLRKEYMIPDDDNIKGMVFFMVYKLPTQFSLDYNDLYESSDTYDSSDSYDSIDGIHVNIRVEVTRNDGKRITCGSDIRLEGWLNTDSVDQLYSCYFQGLSWFGIPLQKGGKLVLSADPAKSAHGYYLDYKMLEFVVSNEAVEDDQQLEKGVKQLITSMVEGEPKNDDSPYRMPSVSGGRREC